MLRQILHTHHGLFQTLRPVPVHNVPFDFALAFPHSKSFKFACCLEGFHLRIALNLPKYCMPFFINIGHMPCLSQICPAHINLQQRHMLQFCNSGTFLMVLFLLKFIFIPNQLPRYFTAPLLVAGRCNSIALMKTYRHD